MTTLVATAHRVFLPEALSQTEAWRVDVAPASMGFPHLTFAVRLSRPDEDLARGILDAMQRPNGFARPKPTPAPTDVRLMYQSATVDPSVVVFEFDFA